ncbi:MAG: hypothetical protein HY878_05470 [Deltaproteobacteria bacterium]|nr:hypothetical protein [Deltaproteobacteria bacterium]
MKDQPLHIAFLWHMHQPVYKDPFTGEYTLPWVRLHGTKDYYDMVAILDSYPKLHQTFNIVPSLVDQLMDYTEGKASDRFMKLSQRPAHELTVSDKIAILKGFFLANWENMIKPFPWYWELLKKRGFHFMDEDIEDTLRYFSIQDLLDLQVLFNLAWIDPLIRERDGFLKALVEKGRGYTEEEKAELLRRQIDILRTVIPKYRELKDKGTIELTTSPYYHPILPLLCDTDNAREAMPWVELPKKRFAHPEDALEQIRRGIKLHEGVFGDRPKGMWPPEGGVSEAIIPVVAGEGIEWVASDEEILAHSLGRPIKRDSSGHCLDPDILYKPYLLTRGGRRLAIVFRDRTLSNLIGFVYSTWEIEKAANDFMDRLLHIYNSLKGVRAGRLVTIALDGENAWEYYKKDGAGFLNALYTRLSEDPRFKPVTISEHIEEFPPQEGIQRLYAGSWINHNFKIWIGHQEDNTAWDYLADAREVLVNYENTLKKSSNYLDNKDKISNAWWEIYIAEGSDWFWWYGEEHASLMDVEFDELYRNHLKKVYILIGKEPPPALDIPIMSEKQVYEPPVRPTAFINPVIDGEVSNYFEWLAAGRIEREVGGGAMHREKIGGCIIETIAYGFNLGHLFFRLDYAKSITPCEKKWDLILNFIYPRIMKVEAAIDGLDIDKAVIWWKETDKKGRWVNKGRVVDNIKIKDVVEMAIPFKKLGVKGGDGLKFFIVISSEESGIEQWPIRGYVTLDVPTEDFEGYNWWV